MRALKWIAAALFVSTQALAQSYPSPVYQNVTIRASTLNQLLLGGGTGAPIAPLGSLGATTTVLHGNAAGIPSFAAVDLVNDVGTSRLPYAHFVQGAANTIVANATGALADFAATSVPSCSTSSSALQWVTSTGFACNSSITTTAANVSYTASGSNPATQTVAQRFDRVVLATDDSGVDATGIVASSDGINRLLGSFYITGNLTSGSAVMTNISSTTGLSAGMKIFGQGLPLSATTILSVDSATQLTLSQNANATITGNGYAVSSSTGKKYVLLPCGNYLIDKSIFVPDNSWLQGSGECTKLNISTAMVVSPFARTISAAGAERVLFLNADWGGGGVNIHVSDLHVDATTVLAAGNFFGVFVYNQNGLEANGLNIEGWSGGSVATNGVNFINSHNINIHDNRKTGASGNGACYDGWGGSYDFRIVNNYCYGGGATDYGIQINGANTDGTSNSSHHGVIADNVIDSIDSASLDIYGLQNGGGSFVHDVIVSNNVIRNTAGATTGVGMRIGQAYNISAIGNIIEGVAGFAYSIKGAVAADTTRDIVVSGGSVKDSCAVPTSAVFSIGNSSDAPTNVIIGPTDVNSPLCSYVYDVRANAVDTTIYSGRTVSGSTGTILDLGTNTLRVGTGADLYSFAGTSTVTWKDSSGGATLLCGINSGFPLCSASSSLSLQIGGSSKFTIVASSVSAAVKLNTVASATGAAGLNIPHGAAPTSPVNGDFWTTTTGAFLRVNSATKTVADLESTQTFSGEKRATTQAANDNSTKLATTAYADAIAAGASGTYARKTVIQTFTSSGTYTPTDAANLKVANVIAFGAGGGGGGGALQAAGAACSGGAAGGGGARTFGWFSGAQIGASQSVTIGAGGTGGAAQTGAGALAGNNGTAGGATGFGAGNLLVANGGGFGAGGQLAGNSGGGAGAAGGVAGANGSGGTGGTGILGGGSGGSGAAGVNSSFPGAGAGGAGGPNAAAGTQGGGTVDAASGGGSGGGITAANATANGGAGGTLWNQLRTGGTAGVAGGAKNGGDGTAVPSGAGPLNQAGTGAGGGASDVTAAGNGGAGGLGGGGGGGGGCAQTGGTSGAGGNGAAGYLVVIENY